MRPGAAGPAIHALIICLALGAGALYCLWQAIKAMRTGRAVRDTPTSRVRSAAQGYVELHERGRLLDGSQTRAPLTHLPCTWWSFKIEELDERGRRRSWNVVSSDTSQTPFLLDDGTGTCIVDPRGAQVFGARKITWYGDSPQPLIHLPAGTLIEKIVESVFHGRYRYTELRLDVDSPLYGIGAFRSVGGVEVADVEGDAVRLLRDWKRDQPALLRRFDTNRDGSIDAREWEAARIAARAQVQREAAQRPVAPIQNVLEDPGDGRAFLLAQEDATNLERRFTRRIAAGLGGFVLGAAVLGWYLQQV